MALNPPFGPCQYCSALAPYAGYTVNGSPVFRCHVGTGCQKTPPYSKPSPYRPQIPDTVCQNFDTRDYSIFLNNGKVHLRISFEIIENLSHSPGTVYKYELLATNTTTKGLILEFRLPEEQIVDEIVQKFIEANKKAEEEKD